jgi:hypothetical protein
MSWLSRNQKRIEIGLVLCSSLVLLYWYWSAQFGKSISFYIQLFLQLFPSFG